MLTFVDVLCTHGMRGGVRGVAVLVPGLKRGVQRRAAKLEHLSETEGRDEVVVWCQGEAGGGSCCSSWVLYILCCVVLCVMYICCVMLYYVVSCCAMYEVSCCGMLCCVLFCCVNIV